MEHGHGSGGCCHGDHGRGEGAHHGDCCHHEGHHGRHYFTSEEKAAHLEKYLEQLKAETAGVEEELKKLKSA
jgi:hypothetical protein